jgi:peptidyl-tRNA hydrolase
LASTKQQLDKNQIESRDIADSKNKLVDQTQHATIEQIAMQNVDVTKEWEQRLQEATTKRAESKTALEDSQQLSSEISSKTAANDDTESTILAPGKEEIDS